MRFEDLLQLGMANLWRTKLRTILTTLGVTIGIGALVSMVSFGTGMQKNITEAFKENELFTSIQVTSQKIDLEEAMAGNIPEAIKPIDKESPPLDDNALEKIKEIPGVEIAFPEIRFPVKIRLGASEAKANLRAMPAVMAQHTPFKRIPYGGFFPSDTSSSVIVSQELLKELKIVIRDPERPKNVSLIDSLRGVRSLPPDSLLGKPIELVTSVIDVRAMMKNPLAHVQDPTDTPFEEKVTSFRIGGILKKRSDFENQRLTGSIIVPIKTAEKIPRLGFTSIWSLLETMGKEKGYASLYVRLKNIRDLDPVREKIEEMGFGVLSIADQLDELKKGFFILDAGLGAVGTVALIVAALGIINTMVMSILERTREIGVMKAIGGSENEIKGIFIVEAASIGFIGGLFGLILGWLVTLIANAVVNATLVKQDGNPVDFFYIPYWLILGAIVFSLLISLVAGLYPASRAARVDPVKALRHD